MSVIKPFRPLRPRVDLAAQIASPPYDVVSRQEARALVAGNLLSFLRVGRADLELSDGTDPYSAEVYQRGAANLQRLVDEEALFREPEPVFAFYRQIMGDHSQTGLVALASVSEYDTGFIKKHEFTKPDKEADRVRLIECHNSQSGPVFLTFKKTDRVAACFKAGTAGTPEIDFTADDGIQHTVWLVREGAAIQGIVDAFGAIPALYIADGHHRSAAASRVCAQRTDSGTPADASHSGFLSVIFPDDALQILAYNRVVRDLNGHSPESLLEKISEQFDIAPTSNAGNAPPRGFDLYLAETWYRAVPDPTSIPSDPVAKLAVSILSDRVLAPILGITDQRTDKRIDFVGGIRGVGALEKAVDSGEWALALALHPTTVSELLAVADADQVMPPKSTWFEPKLRDGLFIHVLD